MAETCQICNKKIGLMDKDIEIGRIHMHYACLRTFEADPEKYGGKAKKNSIDEFLKEPVDEEWIKEDRRKLELREKSKGMVLTDIDLPFERVLWVSFQFFIAGLIIALPIWLVIFFIVS